MEIKKTLKKERNLQLTRRRRIARIKKIRLEEMWTAGPWLPGDFITPDDIPKDFMDKPGTVLVKGK